MFVDQLILSKHNSCLNNDLIVCLFKTMLYSVKCKSLPFVSMVLSLSIYSYMSPGATKLPFLFECLYVRQHPNMVTKTSMSVHTQNFFKIMHVLTP